MEYNYIDTHSHLYLADYDVDRDKVIVQSLQAGVQKILLPNIHLASIEKMLAVCQSYSNMCFPMLGLHPCDVKTDYKEVLQVMFKVFDKHRFIAIGEVGIDLYWDAKFLQQQKDALRWQIDFALQQQLPLIVHKRQSYYEVLAVLDEFEGEPLKGIFHCYSGSVEHAHELIRRGFLLGIGGTVTYKNAKLDEILPYIDLRYLVLETDSPFLAPAPHRGKRNTSQYLPLIAEKIAVIKQLPLETVASQTTRNALDLFDRLNDSSFST
jgi:TatD DNase family protein